MRSTMMKSMARMMVTFAASYVAAKTAGWVFDQVTGNNR